MARKYLKQVGEMPYTPCKYALGAFTAYLACAFTYPFAVTSRQMIELWPKDKGGVCTWNGNYRKAMSWLWCTSFKQTMSSPRTTTLASSKTTFSNNSLGCS